MPARLCRSSATERLRRSSGRRTRRAPACAVGSLGRLDLHHGGARTGQQVAAQWPRPQGRQVDDEQAVSVGPWGGVAAAARDHTGASVRSAASPTRATGSPRSWALAASAFGSDPATGWSTDGGPHRGDRRRDGVELEPGRDRLHVFGPRQRHRHEPVGGGRRRQLPPQLVAPRRHSPINAARSPRSASASRPGKDEARRSIPSTRPAGWPERFVGQPGQRHGAALCPALHPGVVHVGRVTSRDPRTSQRRLTPRRAAQRHRPERSGAVMVDLNEGMPAPADMPQRDRASLPFVVVGVTRGGAVDEPLARPVRCGRRRRRPGSGHDRGEPRPGIPSPPPRWPCCSAGRTASPSVKAWWRSLPPIPSCSPGPSSPHGGPRIRPVRSGTRAPGCGVDA